MFSETIKYIASKEICAQVAQLTEPWQVYQNQKQGWKISYPNNFIVRETENWTTFTSPGEVIRLIHLDGMVGGGVMLSTFQFLR